MTTPTFTTPPTAPTRASPSTFVARANAFLSWLVGWVAELTTAVTWFEEKTDATEGFAEDADVSRGLSAASQLGSATSASNSAASEAAALAYAASALSAPGTTATSDDSFALPAVAAVITKALVQTGKTFVDGMILKWVSRATPADYFTARLSGFTGTTAVTLTVLTATGVGNVHADWNVFPTNDPLIGAASQAEAEAGVENSKGMTALRTKQAISAQAPRLATVVFTTAGAWTWTVPADVTKVKVRAWGGGGGGSSGGGGAGGAGGTGGSYGESILTVAAGDTLSGSVGAAGATSAGVGGNTTVLKNATLQATAPGSGGAPTGFTGQTVLGEPGWGSTVIGMGDAGTYYNGGKGGAGALGGSGGQPYPFAAGGAGIAPGGGGAGSTSSGGYAGAVGRVVIEY